MISVVIPSYNRKDSVLALLSDLGAQQGVDSEIIVVDDHSSDNTVAAIREHYPWVLVLENPRNEGPAVTRNRGIQQANADIVIGLDSDVAIPNNGLLANVESIMRSTLVTGLAFRLKSHDGVTDDAPRWWHSFPIETHAAKAFDTSYFSGTAYAFRREALVSAGLFSTIFFMHFEEVELAWRILDQGGSIRYSPELEIIHHAHTVSRRSEVEVFYKPRNQLLLAASCLPLQQALAYVAPRTTFQLLKACFRGHLPQFIASMVSAARLLPSQLSQRRPLHKDTIRRIKFNNLRKDLSCLGFKKV
jgi:GT2 family glycosyltransferase